MKIVTPKRYVPDVPYLYPIFLAGPVRGGGDWQHYFIEHFMNVSVMREWSDSFCDRVLPHIRFFVPCRWKEDHPLAPYFVEVFEEVQSDPDDPTTSQTFWENEYLERSLFKGIIIFGLFPEDKQNPRTDGMPYSIDTLGEIGRWTTIASYTDKQDNLIVGYREDFIGLRTILRNMEIHDSGSVASQCYNASNPQNLADFLARRIFDEVRKLMQ